MGTVRVSLEVEENGCVNGRVEQLADAVEERAGGMGIPLSVHDRRATSTVGPVAVKRPKMTLLAHRCLGCTSACQILEGWQGAPETKQGPNWSLREHRLRHSSSST